MNLKRRIGGDTLSLQAYTLPLGEQDGSLLLRARLKRPDELAKEAPVTPGSAPIVPDVLPASRHARSRFAHLPLGNHETDGLDVIGSGQKPGSTLT